METGCKESFNISCRLLILEAGVKAQGAHFWMLISEIGTKEIYCRVAVTFATTLFFMAFAISAFM